MICVNCSKLAVFYFEKQCTSCKKSININLCKICEECSSKQNKCAICMKNMINKDKTKICKSCGN